METIKTLNAPVTGPDLEQLNNLHYNDKWKMPALLIKTKDDPRTGIFDIYFIQDCIIDDEPTMIAEEIETISLVNFDSNEEMDQYIKTL